MGLPLSDEQWKPIDDWLLQGRKTNAVKAIREAAGVGLRESVDLAEARDNLLRESKPEGFVIDEGLDGYKTETFR